MALVANDEAKDDTGFIRIEADVSEFGNRGIISEVKEAFRFPWYIWVYKNVDGWFGVYLLHACKSVSDMWRIDLSAEFTLVNHNGTNLVQPVTLKSYSRSNKCYGIAKFMQWNDLINEKKGFMKDGKITVEVRFTLSDLFGHRMIPRLDFTKKDTLLDHDLEVGGKKIYVNKEFLASHSSYFKSIFYEDNQADKKENMEKLKGIDHKEFIEMLNHIYPPSKKITDANVEYLLKLGALFDIPKLVNEAEDFLIGSTNLSVHKKYLLSDTFNLFFLQEHCLDKFQTVEEIDEYENTKDYDALSKDGVETLRVKAKILRGY